MKKRLIAAILALVVVIGFMPQGSAEAAGKISKKAAYKAYYKWMKSDDAKIERWYGGYKKVYYKKYTLLDINGDKVPELIALYEDRDGTWINSYKICQFDGTKVNVLETQSGVAGAGGYRGDTTVTPKKGRLYIFSISSGTGSTYEEYYKVTKKGFQKKYDLDFTRSYMNGETLTYKINDKTVSKKKFNSLHKKLERTYNSKKSKSLEDLKYISRKKMLKKLK